MRFEKRLEERSGGGNQKVDDKRQLAPTKKLGRFSRNRKMQVGHPAKNSDKELMGRNLMNKVPDRKARGRNKSELLGGKASLPQIERREGGGETVSKAVGVASRPAGRGGRCGGNGCVVDGGRTV